jgi:signal transduction histidine kinase
MIYLIVFHFLDFEQTKNVKWLNVTIFIFLGSLDTMGHIHYGYQLVRGYDTLIVLGAIFLVNLYALDGFKSWQAWLVIGLSIFISTFVSTVAAGFTFAVMGRDIYLLHMNATDRVIGMLSGILLFLILYGLTNRLKLKMNIYALTKGEVVFITIFLSVFGFFVVDIYALVDHQWGVWRSFLALLSGSVAIYFIMYFATQKSVIKDVENRVKQQELIFHEQQQNYERMNKRNEEIKIFRHNIEDELLYVHNLLNDCEIEEAMMYIKKMRESLEIVEQAVGYDTGSKAVNASWYSLTNNKRYKEITATWIGKIPHHMSIDNRDLVLLFSNLLNNAFEAAKQSSDKYVTVKINEKENGLFISIKNSYQGEIKKALNGDFITSKVDKENHGFGTQIIKNIIVKHNGKIEFSHSGDEFFVLIFFNRDIYKI